MKKTIELPDKLSYGRLMLLSFQIDPLYSFVNLLIQLIGTFLAPYGVILTAKFVDTAIGIFNGTNTAGEIVLPLLLLTLIKFYSIITDMLFAPVTLRHGMTSWKRLEHPFMKRVASLDMKHLEDSELQNEMGSFMEGNLWRVLEFPEIIKSMIFSGIQIVSYLVILYQYVPWIVLLTCVLSLPIIFLAKDKEEFTFRHQKNQQLQGRYNGQYFSYLRGRQAACERGMFGYSEMVSELYTKSLTKVETDIFKGNFRYGVKGNLFGILSSVLCFLAIFLMVPTLVTGTITIGVFISVVNTILTVIPKIASDYSMYTFLFTLNHRQVKLFNKFLALTGNREHTEPMSENPPAFESLEMKNVSFTYPGTEKKILDGVSLKMDAGMKYSLVGINGSGKSTLIKLILRMYDDYEGEILINGKELREWPRCDIKAMFSAVMQNFSKYDISLEDNINMGSGFRAGDDEVDAAITLAGLDDAVSKLADGKKTMLGKIHEKGADLSGGEWQRAAMARSVVHKSGLKILDEPTAALDPIAECDFYQKFDEMTRDAAVIFISHRLASAKNSDCIFVLNDGKIAEQGNHEELMKKQGLYAEMFESQRGWYL